MCAFSMHHRASRHRTTDDRTDVFVAPADGDESFSKPARRLRAAGGRQGREELVEPNYTLRVFSNKLAEGH